LVGAIFIGLFAKSAFRRFKDPQAHKTRMVQRLQKGLELDSGQTEKVAAIINRTQAEMTRSFENARGVHEKLHKEARAEIRELLNDEQKTRFDAFIEKWESRRKRWRSRSGKKTRE